MEPQSTFRRPWVPTDVASAHLQTSGLKKKKKNKHLVQITSTILYCSAFLHRPFKPMFRAKIILGYLNPCLGFSSDHKKQPYLVYYALIFCNEITSKCVFCGIRLVMCGSLSICRNEDATLMGYNCSNLGRATRIFIF